MFCTYYILGLYIGKILEHKLPTAVAIPSMTESEIFFAVFHSQIL